MRISWLTKNRIKAMVDKRVRAWGNRGDFGEYLTPQDDRFLSTRGASLRLKVTDILRLGFVLVNQRVLPFQSTIRRELQGTSHDVLFGWVTEGEYPSKRWNPCHLSSS